MFRRKSRVNTGRLFVDPDIAVLAVRRLCASMSVAVTELELDRLRSLDHGDIALAHLIKLGSRLGITLNPVRVSQRALRMLRGPAILFDSEGKSAWIVQECRDERVVLIEVDSGRRGVFDVRKVVSDAAILVQALPSQQSDQEMVGLKPHLRLLLTPLLRDVALSSLLINIFALALPVFLMLVYNHVVGREAIPLLTMLLVGLGLVMVFDGTLRWVRGQLMSLAASRVDAAISSGLVRSMLNLPFAAFEALPPGQIQERYHQLDRIRDFLGGRAVMIAIDLFFVPVFLFGLFWISAELALAGLLICLILPVLASFVNQDREQLSESRHRSLAHRSSIVMDAIRNAVTVKTLGLEDDIERRHEQVSADYAWLRHALGQRQVLGRAVVFVAQHAAVVTIVVLAIRAIMRGDLTMGALIAVTLFATRLFAPLRHLPDLRREWADVREAVNKLDRLFLRTHDLQKRRRRSGVTKLSGAIAVDALGFKYTRDRAPALRGVQFALNPGEVLAVTGTNGSGKSTLLRLLAGLYRPGHGSITFDGHNASDIPESVLRQYIGHVSQEVQIFPGTIADNLLRGTSGQKTDRMIAAARFVGLDRVIRDLPNGYETLLGEGGIGLSTGQKQLLAIARVLIRNPRILLLDEAMSALDEATEVRLIRELKRAASGHTVIMVTHNIERVRHFADHVLVLGSGQTLCLETYEKAAQFIEDSNAQRKNAAMFGRKRLVS